MIASANEARNRTCSNWRAGFLAMIPHILRHARRAFHHFDAEARAEAVQEVLVSTMLAYIRLSQSGKVDVAYPSVLARYAVAQYRDGRRVSQKLNCQDALSPYAGRRQGIRVESLNSRDEAEVWRERLVEDKHAGPAETAAARIDVGEWLTSLASRNRRIAEALSQGAATRDVARQFGVTPGRISQLRRELLVSWHAFHGEPEARGRGALRAADATISSPFEGEGL